MLNFVVSYSSLKDVEQKAAPSIKMKQVNSFMLKVSKLPTFKDCYNYATQHLKEVEVVIHSINQMQLAEVTQIPTTAKEYLSMPIVLGS